MRIHAVPPQGRGARHPAWPLALQVSYSMERAQAWMDRTDTLALFDFGVEDGAATDPRRVRVPLPALRIPAPHECWSVAGAVQAGWANGLRWSTGGGWRLVVIEIDEADAGGIEAASEQAYGLLLTHVAACPEPHLQRIWNYVEAINSGTGDAERYRLFCNGRARALTTHGVSHYPAATAIGHHGRRGLLQVYALSAARPGRPLENPRQLSAWEYPREYGPNPPRFARAMRLPGTALAISGTAAVTGHASRHPDDVAAQAGEAFANLAALLRQAKLPSFGAASPLKVYVRRPETAPAVEAALALHLDPVVPRLLLHGDICRRELLVEIDGWWLAP